VTDRVA